MAAEREWNASTITPDEFKGHQSAPAAIAAVTKCFSDRFCTDKIHYTIQEDEHGHYRFILFRHVEFTDEWCTIEVKKLIRAAKSCSTALSDVLFIFLNALKNTTNVSTWFGGIFEWAEDYLEERLILQVPPDPFEPDEVSDDVKDMVADLNSHRRGEAARAAAMIQQAKKLTPDQIVARLKKIRKDHPLKDAMLKGCNLLRDPYDVHYYDHAEYGVDPDDYDNGIDAVSFWEQVTMLWEYRNHLTGCHEEWLNSKLHESGQAGPTATFVVSPHRACWNREKFDKADHWPRKLAELFNLLDEAAIILPGRQRRPRKSRKQEQSLLINILHERSE